MHWELVKSLGLALVVLASTLSYAHTFDPAAHPEYLPVGYGAQPAWIWENP